MQLDQPPDDRQANAKPTLRPLRIAVNVPEHLEDLRKRVRRNADAIISEGGQITSLCARVEIGHATVVKIKERVARIRIAAD